VLSCAPPDAGRCEGEVAEAIKRRLRRALSCAIEHGVRTVVLGAFGCGGCGNDPAAVARIEKELLIDEGLARYFDAVENPVADDGRALAAFREELGPFGGGE
jgi:uncharacterized protein (TIGR02452 family)